MTGARSLRCQGGLGPTVAGRHDMRRRRVGRFGNDRADNPDDVPLLFCPADALVNARTGLAKSAWNATL